MNNAEDYRKKLMAMGLDELEITASSPEEAKKVLAEMRQRQKELRQLKSMLNLDMKTIRNDYEQKKQGAGEGGFALIGLFGKRGLATQHRANAKRQINAKRDQELRPYQNIKMTIDDLLLQIDQIKIQFQQYIDEKKAEQKNQ